MKKCHIHFYVKLSFDFSARESKVSITPTRNDLITPAVPVSMSVGVVFIPIKYLAVSIKICAIVCIPLMTWVHFVY